jgi:hypothetical protein
LFLLLFTAIKLSFFNIDKLIASCEANGCQSGLSFSDRAALYPAFILSYVSLVDFTLPKNYQSLKRDTLDILPLKKEVELSKLGA